MYFSRMSHSILRNIIHLGRKIYSLSYQLKIRTIRWYITWTCRAAITKLSGRTKRSDGTSGLFVIFRIPKRTVFTYIMRTETSVLLASWRVKSAAKTLDIGTQTAQTFSRSKSLGRIISINEATDLVVGTIESAAAQLRSKADPCGTSKVGWLPV